jgi:hypothetical protein
MLKGKKKKRCAAKQACHEDYRTDYRNHDQPAIGWAEAL